MAASPCPPREADGEKEVPSEFKEPLNALVQNCNMLHNIVGPACIFLRQGFAKSQLVCKKTRMWCLSIYIFHLHIKHPIVHNVLIILVDHLLPFTSSNDDVDCCERQFRIFEDIYYVRIEICLDFRPYNCDEVRKVRCSLLPWCHL